MKLGNTIHFVDVFLNKKTRKLKKYWCPYTDVGTTKVGITNQYSQSSPLTLNFSSQIASNFALTTHSFIINMIGITYDSIDLDKKPSQSVHDCWSILIFIHRLINSWGTPHATVYTSMMQVYSTNKNSLIKYIQFTHTRVYIETKLNTRNYYLI